VPAGDYEVQVNVRQAGAAVGSATIPYTLTP
jgi:hypothetical protein